MKITFNESLPSMSLWNCFVFVIILPFKSHLMDRDKRLNLIWSVHHRKNVSNLRSSHWGSDCSCCRGWCWGCQPCSISCTKGFRRGAMAENVCLCNTFLQAATLTVSSTSFLYLNCYIHCLFCVDFQERSRILLRFADLIEKHTPELSALETWNNGKPYEQSLKSELPLLVRLFHYYAG